MTHDDNYSTAIHEAGHAISASHFRIASYPEITPGGFSLITQSVSPEHVGLCHFDNSPMTPFQSAVISWGGLLAECLYGNLPFWTPFKPSAKMLRDWHGMVMQQIKRLSDGDRRGILGYDDNWRSCKSAFAIVRKNRARIIRLATAITGATAKPSVPMPETFPASVEDFLRLVIAADDAEKQYANFLSDSVKTFWASGFSGNYEAALPILKNHFLNSVIDEVRAKHPGRSDDEISQALFDEAFQTAMEVERKRFERGLENRNCWENAVVKYRAWSNRGAS